MLTPFELTLLFIISGLLLLCAWQSYHHELRRPSRPPFENYGVDISVAPCIGIADTPGRLPSFTIREFGGA